MSWIAVTDQGQIGAGTVLGIFEEPWGPRLSSAFEQRKVTWRIAARRRGLLLFPPSSASQKPAARALAGTGGYLGAGRPCKLRWRASYGLPQTLPLVGNIAVSRQTCVFDITGFYHLSARTCGAARLESAPVLVKIV
jgi:hypothetical protein